MRFVSSTFALLLGALVAFPSAAQAGSILFSGSGAGVAVDGNGVTLSASALFDITGSTLTITLRNLGDNGLKDVPGNTLTGVLFNLPDGITLTPVSALIAAGDLLQTNKCTIGPCSATTTNVGGEFRYDTATLPSGSGADRGISSSGYIGGNGNFNGPNLDAPPSGAVNGINFGIVGPGSLVSNGGLQNVPLISEEVVFQMTISGGTLATTDIANVSFQYGTDYSEPRYSGSTTTTSVPEPATLALVGAGLAVALRRRRAGKSGV
jgi:hypothetical protein